MSGCSGNCSSCSSNCDSKKQDLHIPGNPMSDVKKVIGVVSGKGGVGKSFVTSSLAVTAQTMGYQTAILDADITGPSIPKAFGVHGNPEGTADGMYPLESKLGTRIMSVNLLLQSEDQPVIWRGPVISGLIHQFWQETVWGDVDFMFVDMPPGTGDVPLTVFQSLPVDGVVIVTSPISPGLTGLLFSSRSSTIIRSAGICPPLCASHSVNDVCISVEAYVEYNSSVGHFSFILLPNVVSSPFGVRRASPMQIARLRHELL